ncbi:ArsR/SmtB family transcription factor [Kushneria aurantia]|uniref:ArsR/SmtB family transcription factor n=1 Tax=Kushneria aurantia TaxID=504092 RepID=A0ABV6G822_9GAMM|nr:hypothetical protein [Kushneria aurantia]
MRDAGLILATREGRQVRYRIAPEGMQPLVDWLARYRDFWPERLDNLKTLLKEMAQ